MNEAEGGTGVAIGRLVGIRRRTVVGVGVGVSIGICVEVGSGAVVEASWIAVVGDAGAAGSRDGALGASPWVQAAINPRTKRTNRHAIKVTFKAAPLIGAALPPFDPNTPGS